MRRALVGVFAEDVAHDYDRLLHHVAHASLDQVHQHVDAALRCHVQVDRAPPDGAHRLIGNEGMRLVSHMLAGKPHGTMLHDRHCLAHVSVISRRQCA